MTHPHKRGSIPLQDLSACCPEAQADGVPCQSLGRNCEECERAVAVPDEAAPGQEAEDRTDPWAV